MTRLDIFTGDWVVVCDGRKAILCRNAGDELSLNLQVVEEREIDNPPTRAQGADRPGRVHESASTERSSVEDTDWHDAAERQFLRGVAERLHRAVSAGELGGVVLIAPPRALGMIRPLLSPAVAKVVRREIDRDYVNLPIGKVERLLKK